MTGPLRHGTDLELRCRQCGTTWTFDAEAPAQCPDCADHLGEPAAFEPHYDCPDCRGVCSLTCDHDCKPYSTDVEGVSG